MTIEKKSRITAITRNFKLADGSVESVEGVLTHYFEDTETGEITLKGTESISELSDADLDSADTTAKGLVDISSLQSQVAKLLEENDALKLKLDQYKPATITKTQLLNAIPALNSDDVQYFDKVLAALPESVKMRLQSLESFNLNSGLAVSLYKMCADAGFPEVTKENIQDAVAQQ